MSKYIDVESLINLLEKCQFDIEDSIYGKGFGRATETMLGILRAYPRVNVAPIADTVRKMSEMLKDYLDDYYHSGEDALLDVPDMIDLIAKEMLEGKND